MREDVRVGDVKLTVDAKTVPHGVLPFRDIARLDLTEEMRTYYEQRASYPVDQSFSKGQDGSKPWVQPVSPTGIFVENKSDVNRLRMAALPGVKVATVAQGTLGGKIPLQGASVGGAIAAKGTRVLDISLTGVEEVRAPDDFTVFRKFEQACLSKIDQHFSDSNLSKSLALMTDKPVDQSLPQLAIITQVYYARGVDYTFKSDQGYGADLVATVGALGEMAKLSAALGNKEATTTPANSSGVPQDAEASATAKEIADLVAAMRTKIAGATAPGLTFSTVFADTRGVTLREVFQVPLAFGAQVVTFRYVPGQSICAASVAAPGENRMQSTDIGSRQ